MKDTRTYRDSAGRLLLNAKAELLADMKERNIGAIIWDLARAGFPLCA